MKSILSNFVHNTAVVLIIILSIMNLALIISCYMHYFYLIAIVVLDVRSAIIKGILGFEWTIRKVCVDENKVLLRSKTSNHWLIHVYHMRVMLAFWMASCIDSYPVRGKLLFLWARNFTLIVQYWLLQGITYFIQFCLLNTQLTTFISVISKF